MGFRVCIPTAGTGSRLGGMTRYINKSLVSIANRPTICHIIEQFPDETEFVIALGHKGELVKEFLSLAYPQRTFFFADVNRFEGEGSGLGLSLLACKDFLQEPFIFISCDTLVKEEIPAPINNWMAYADVENLDPYRSIQCENGLVIELAEKLQGSLTTHHAYIGLAGIHDYQQFWDSMISGGDEAIRVGESCGLRALLPKNMSAYPFTWFDTGNERSLERAREIYREPGEPNILEKANEAIWFMGDQVVKFSDDKKFIQNRVLRSNELLGFVPEVTASTPHMYRYTKVKGDVVSAVVTLPLFKKLLDFCDVFWKKAALQPVKCAEFEEVCLKFYKDKTYERVNLFYKNFSKVDGREKMNGIEMPHLDELLQQVDWAWLAKGLPGRFHGDFHFENILWDRLQEKFVFLDWRQDFGGDLTTGDIYYDFAKLLHGLIISHELIAGDFYSVSWGKDEIAFDFHRKQILVECEQYFEIWLKANGYDFKKVKVLTALIYLNIAALHHHPYSLLLFSLGKSMLKSKLEK